MQTSILLFCVLSLSLTATAYGGLLVADHPVGQEVNATGDSVTLECSATSVGEISHWLLNGARLDPASMSGVDVSISSGAGGSSTLSISSYQPSNAGEYRCVARSVQQDDDTVEVSHAARLSHFTQRTFTIEPQNFTVYALPPPSDSETGTPSREAAAFNCEFSALPRFGRRPVIVWEIERASTGVAEVLDLSGSNTRSTFQYDHIGYFQLHTPTEMDDGSRVRCLARHPQDPSQQVESQWATITISNSSLPTDFPVFTTQMPAKMYHIDGQQLVMGCSKSKPTAGLDLQWIGTGSTFPFFTAGISLIIIRRDVVSYGHSNVEIPDSSIDGVINETFTCRYTDSSNNEFSWNTTIVEPPPPLPPLIYNDQSSSATLDFGSAGINLVATNYTGRVTWWFNGAPVPTDGSSQKYSITPDMLTLTIRNIVFNDSGLYQAELTDAEPTQFLNYQIDVRGGAAFVLPPPNDQQTVDVGTPSILFDCPTDGNIPPVTTHSWTFNGTPISHDDSNYILYPNGSLAVNDVQPSNAGMYTCTPQNALGSFNSSSVTLIVNGGAAFVLPLPNDQQTVDVGTPSVLFDCLTDGNIPPVTNHSWTFNGTPISHDGSNYILYPNGSLAVNDVQPSNAGMYTCTPQNTLGSFNSSSVTLIVNGGAAFVLPLPNDQQTVDVGTPSVLFDCLTDGNIPPVTTHSWTFNGIPITHNGSKYILCPNGSLAVNDIQPSDAGMYTCTPQNTLGSFNSSSVTLVVNAPPGAPRISYVAIVEETSIFVNWTALDDVNTYTLEIRTSHEEDRDSDDQDDSDDHDDANDSNDRENVKSLVLDTNTHVIPNADFDVIYHFRVKATNDFGSSDFSAAYKFDPESAEESGHGKRRAGLHGWEIVLIVIFIILILLLCCIFFVCVFICWRRENRTYYAAKKEKEMQDSGVEAYRQTSEPDNKDE